ncbi:MAG: 3-deoxy-D-manno-octulosonic acid transferase [Deltaproteobacteria bacterium]|nr:3-deoxy-D-manno-octulosonic acid transferase [Deltaproteobacteria bacterium]
MTWLYRAFSYLVIGAALPFLSLHPKLRRGARRRLGLYRQGERPFPASRGSGPRIWLHGASAGDLTALLPVIVELRARIPDATLIVSTMTSSGHAIAEERIKKHVDALTYVPWDLPGATRRAMAAIDPSLLVLEYAEMWPNLLAAARSRGARIAVVNGRLHERLLRRYRFFYRLFGNPLPMIDLLLMREEVEAERALDLGAPRGRVHATGNTKFDNVARPPAREVVERLRAAFSIGDEPIFVAGSTHEGEERVVIAAYRAMREVAPRLRMILAPRYTERGGRVASLVESEGLRVVRRSEMPADASGADVLVLDTIGELTAAYQLARLVFVGGSFVERGGQNILEPAGLGRPVLFGPNMMNFRDAVEVLLGRGGIQVATPARLAEIGRELLGKPEEIAHLGEMAKAAVQKVSGASVKNAEALVDLLRSRPA